MATKTEKTDNNGGETQAAAAQVPVSQTPATPRPEPLAQMNSWLDDWSRLLPWRLPESTFRLPGGIESIRVEQYTDGDDIVAASYSVSGRRWWLCASDYDGKPVSGAPLHGFRALK